MEKQITIIILTKDMTNEAILTNATLQNAITKLTNMCGTLNCESCEDSPMVVYSHFLNEEEKETIVKELTAYSVTPAFLTGSKEFFEMHEEPYGLNFSNE